MIQAAHSAARTDDKLMQVYTIVEKRYGRNVAIMHVANKMIPLSDTCLQTVHCTIKEIGNYTIQSLREYTR